MSLMLRKSLAAYLSATTQVDLSQLYPYKPNRVQRRDATLVYSSAAAGNEPARLADLDVTGAFATNAADSPCYIGTTWTDQVLVDAVRVYWPAGSTAPTVKLQTYDGSTWTDEAASPVTALIVGWNLIRLKTSQYCKGVRMVYVSGGDDVRLRCSEFEAYSDLRVEPRPMDWASGGIHVLHTDLDLSYLDPDGGGLVTVGEGPTDQSDGEIGAYTVEERAALFVGLHAKNEDVLDRHRTWAQLALELAMSPDRDGNLLPGIPLRGLRYRLTPIAGGAWWSSGQPGWYVSPAPVVYVAGTVTAPTTIDYGRGRVELTGVANTVDVRADFTAGVWQYSVVTVTPAMIETPAQILHRHNVYLALQAVGQYRAVQDALI